jgi:Tol biopolymer transport system component
LAHSEKAGESVRSVLPSIVVIAALSVAASSGPDDRQETNPKSIESPADPQAGPIPIDELYFTRSVGDPSWSPDGNTIVFTTDLTGRDNLWKVSASGSWPIQLSQSDDRQYGALWSPDGKWILYESDRGGQEYFDLFAIPADGGEAVNLTNTPEISETDPHFSPGGATLAISYKPKASPVPDIALLDWRTHAVRNLTKEQAKDQLWRFIAWSPDGKSIFATRTFVGFTDSSVYRVDVETGERLNLTPHQGQILYLGSSLSADGRSLLITSNEKGGFSNVALLDVATKKLNWVTNTQWDAHAGGFASNGTKFTFVINEDGRTDAYLADRDSGHPEKIAFPPGLTTSTGNPSPFSPTGEQILVSHQGSKRPSDLWIYDARTRSRRQLTFSAIAGLRPSSLPQSQLVHYKSFDGRVVSALPNPVPRGALNPSRGQSARTRTCRPIESREQPRGVDGCMPSSLSKHP